MKTFIALLTALTLLGAGHATASTSIEVTYTVTSDSQYAMVRFDSTIEHMRLDWSNLENAYYARKRFFAPREHGFTTSITGGTRTACKIKFEGVGVKDARGGGNTVTCQY